MKFFQLFIYSLAIYLCVSPVALFSKTILWDLGYVLFKPNKIKAAHHIGMIDALIYILTEGDQETLQDKVFTILNQSHGTQTGAEHTIARSRDKTPLPRAIVKWHAGIGDPEKILTEAFEHVEQADREGFFKSKREKKLVRNSLKLIFDPTIMADILRPINKGIQLVKECKKNGHTQMIFSNFDEPSMKQLYNTKHGQKVFSLFDHRNIIISGTFENHKYLKPSTTFFKYLLKTYDLEPTDCILIDDQEENINAARSLGIITIQLKNNDYNAVRTELKKLGVIAQHSSYKCFHHLCQ